MKKILLSIALTTSFALAGYHSNIDGNIFDGYGIKLNHRFETEEINQSQQHFMSNDFIAIEKLSRRPLDWLNNDDWKYRLSLGAGRYKGSDFGEHDKYGSKITPAFFAQATTDYKLHFPITSSFDVALGARAKATILSVNGRFQGMLKPLISIEYQIDENQSIGVEYEGYGINWYNSLASHGWLDRHKNHTLSLHYENSNMGWLKDLGMKNSWGIELGLEQSQEGHDHDVYVVDQKRHTRAFEPHEVSYFLRFYSGF